MVFDVHGLQSHLSKRAATNVVVSERERERERERVRTITALSETHASSFT